MKVSELIDQLSKLDPNAEVWHMLGLFETDSEDTTIKLVEYRPCDGRVWLE